MFYKSFLLSNDYFSMSTKHHQENTLEYVLFTEAIAT